MPGRSGPAGAASASAPCVAASTGAWEEVTTGYIAANGSVEVGQECAVALVGDATELVSREKAERLEGIGIPPAKELLQKLVDNRVPVYV